MNPSSSQFPTSHVQVSPQSEREYWESEVSEPFDRRKSDRTKKGNWGPDDLFKKQNSNTDAITSMVNKDARKSGKTPVVKINSNK